MYKGISFQGRGVGAAAYPSGVQFGGSVPRSRVPQLRVLQVPAPMTRTPSMFCPDWGFNWEPSAAQASSALQTEPLLIKAQYIMKSFSQKLSFWRVFQALTGILDSFMCFAFVPITKMNQYEFSPERMLPFGSACCFG